MAPAKTPALAAALVATGLTMLVLDLLWLGVIAQEIYWSALGDLVRPTAYWPAALLFYAMYVTAIVVHAVLPSATPSTAARRGAAMGFFAYATYELTNWAVLSDWPAVLVPIDVTWGVVLTGLAAAAGKLAEGRTSRSEP